MNLRRAIAAFWAGLLLASTAPAQDMLKFSVLPEAQTTYPGFIGLGPVSMYRPETGFGWTTAPAHFDTYPRFVGCPDRLACHVAAPSPPLFGTAAGYLGSFEFRADVPPGEYGVQVLSGNYAYLPSQADSKNSNFDPGTGRYVLPAPEQIAANGTVVFERSFTQEDLVAEYYHDMDTVLRRGMTPWDRYVAWRFPGRMFRATAADQGLTLRFSNMPVNAIVIWPSQKESEARAFLAQLLDERRAQFPVRDATPPPEGRWTPPPEARKKGYALFVPHELDPIYPRTVPRPEWLKSEVSSFGAPGQLESFVFAVYPLKDLVEGEVSVSDLAGPEGAVLPSSAVDVRAMRYFEKNPCNGVDTYITRAYLPLKWTKIPIDRGINRVYWLTLRPPEDAKPGLYRGTLTFQAANAPPSTLDLAYRILPFQLDPLTNRFHALYHDYYAWPGGSEDRRAQAQRDAGFNVITTKAGMPNLAYSEGRLGPLDFSEWEKALDVYRRNGFPMLLVVSQGATSPAYTATREPRRDPDYRGRAHAVKGSFSPAFEEAYKQLVRAISDEFQARQWPDIIFYDGGELACEGPRGVATETHLMKLLHEAGVKNTTAISGPSAALSMKNSVPYMYLTLMHEFTPENIQRIRETGSRLGAYGPGESRFERGFWFWRSGAILCSEEGGACFYGNPYDSLDCSTGAERSDWGDVYPTPDGPAPSVFALRKREGIDDSRYLFHLERLIAEANETGSDTARQAAAEARQLLDDIAQGIELDIHAYWEGTEEPSGPVLDALRLRVAEQILALEQAR